jgi:hypothetical protein
MGIIGTTKQIPRAEWESYFERFTREHLSGNQPETATVEVVSPNMGDQFEATEARLLGLDYDPKDDAFELALEGVDHLSFQPSEIWVIEDEGGFLSAIELGHPDGTKEIVYLHRGEAAEEAAAPPQP